MLNIIANVNGKSTRFRNTLLLSILFIGIVSANELSRDSIMSVFANQIKLIDRFNSDIADTAARAILEKYTETTYSSALDHFEGLFAQSADSALLRMFMKVIIADSSSAFEDPLAVLGKVFTFYPEMFFRLYQSFPANSKQVLSRDLEFGYFAGIAPTIKNKLKRSKLDKIYSKMIIKKQ
jgi:hypothetical protein